jgi:hypothetical protein
MESEWIEHDGKGPPDLPPGTIVQIKWMDGTHGSEKGSRAELLDWRWVDPFDDIKAYRVIPND